MIEQRSRRSLIWKTMCCILAVAMVFFCQTGARAREKTAETVRLNLRQLIDGAIAASPETGIVRSDIATAQTALEQVKAAYYPRLETTAVVGPVQDAEEPIIRNNRIHDPSPGLRFSSIGIFGRLDIRIVQPVYTFGKLSNNKEAARWGVAAKKQEIDKTKDEIALRVKQLYYAYVLAHSGIGAADDAEAFFDDARRRIKRLLKAGSPNVSQSDLYILDAYSAGIIRSRAEAEKGVAFTMYTLRSMLEIPPGACLEIVKEPLGVSEEKLADLKSFVRKAFSNRPEFKQLQEALQAKKYQTAAAVSDRYPSFFVALESSLAGAPGRDHFENAYINDEFNHAYAGVVAGATWEFDFGMKKARVDQARAEYNKLLYSRKTAERGIPIQVAQAYEEIIEWEKSAQSYHEAAIASRKWVVSAFADFDMGLGTAENMLRAIEKYGDNQGSYIEALYNYNVAVANLRYATGMIRH